MLDTFTHASSEAIKAIAEEMEVRRTKEVFLLFAMGSQFDHLIYQAVSRLGVYCLVADPTSVTLQDVRTLSPKGIILSGGPASVVTEPPPFDATIFDYGIPVLGICLGFQMWAKHIGADVRQGARGEFGVHTMSVVSPTSSLLAGLEPLTAVLQSHGDEVGSGRLTVHAFTNVDERGHKSRGTVAAASWKHLHGVQFHPEVSDTIDGERVFENFCFRICQAQDRFLARDIALQKIDMIRKVVGNEKVLFALSGGTDSSVVAFLLRQAFLTERRVRAVYIKGIDRPDDELFVRKYFGNQRWLELVMIDASEQFLQALKGVTSMKEKRLAVRSVYKPILEAQARDFGAGFIAQGTLYTDISESGGGHSSGARKATIKIHHNTNLGFNLPELIPLADCVKDGVREIGRQIGVPEPLLTRHPFPGPGLVVRIEGEITPQKLAMARQLDDIYIAELRMADLYDSVWQAGVVVTQSWHTTTKGDDAGGGFVVAYWAVWSVNGFTAQAADLPFDFRKRFARRVGSEVAGVGAVVYRDSDKPFSTIEWG